MVILDLTWSATMPAKFDEELQRAHVMMPVSLLTRINAWRRQQEDFPTLSETIMFAAESFEGTLTDLYVPKKK